MRSIPALLALVLLACNGLIGVAGVGDPTIQTSHPQYPGEGSFQTIEQCVAYATAGKTTDQDKAIALFKWILTHQYHADSPQEYLVPGRVPNTKKEDREMVVFDANRGRFSYGYGLSGAVHAWNEPYWKELGMKARERGFPAGHINSEIEYGGSWHVFDTDMAGLIFRKDGIVAGYEDIIKDPKLIDNDHSPLPRYPFGRFDFMTMKERWNTVAKGGNWPMMYNSGYAAMPGIVQVRSGETFTRYFDPNFAGPVGRHFWHVLRGGPFQEFTFVNMGEPKLTGKMWNNQGNASYCNGEFVYRPNLSSGAYIEGTVEQSASVSNNEKSPRLRSGDGSDASVTFQHFSPYVICGRPDNGVDSMTGPAKLGLVVTGQAVGTVQLEVSADQGQSWKDAGQLRGSFVKDLTDDVKGRYGWQLRFRWKGKDGLDTVQFKTITQVSHMIYPRLTPGGCAVTYRSVPRSVVPMLPNFALAEKTVVERFEDKALRSPNMVWAGKSEKQPYAYRLEGDKPGWVVFRIPANRPLVEVAAAARYSVPVPPPADCDFHMDISTDGGKTWKLLGKADVPKDNESTSGWMYGKMDVEAEKTRSALVRVHLFAGGGQTGLLAAELYGIQATPAAGAVKLTYAWKEDDKLKTHIENIPVGATEQKFKVPTGKQIMDSYIRIEAP